jgi:hypothetical protein
LRFEVTSICIVHMKMIFINRQKPFWMTTWVHVPLLWKTLVGYD